ncbi:hypothetical protein MA03_02435 [Infirmifilum uzonense]|uniref:Uncharacterized protein n=2 Tax=Thermofilaceae TaxID=114378 RepID=A0A0F7CKW2_9CREN|nr:hypothetical protein MA03_02435 [Infirmifilum uzonense]
MSITQSIALYTKKVISVKNRTVRGMSSKLAIAVNRLRLAHELRRRGVYVRMHAYEYLLGYKGRIAGVLLLEPTRNRASLYLVSGATQTDLEMIVEEALRQIEPGVQLAVNTQSNS